MNRRRLMQSDSSRFMIGNYEVVDLNLPSGLLWATCNVGASIETDYGDYYAYGFGSRKYNPSDGYYENIKDPLDSTHDTATVVLGSGWRMPTENKFQELIDNTDYEWVENFNGSGKNGGKFTSKINPNAYVFFPAAGEYSTSGIFYEGRQGYIWSSKSAGSNWAYHLYFNSKNMYVSNTIRGVGLSVRGVISGG